MVDVTAPSATPSTEVTEWLTAHHAHFEWRDDWEVGDHQVEFDCYEDGGPDTCEYVVLLNCSGDVLASLGCIDDADEDYRREVERDLIAEAGDQPVWIKAGLS